MKAIQSGPEQQELKPIIKLHEAAVLQMVFVSELCR